MKKSIVTGKESYGTSTSNLNGMRRELLRLPDSDQKERSNAYSARDNDDFISSESDRQLLLMRYLPSISLHLLFVCHVS